MSSMIYVIVMKYATFVRQVSFHINTKLFCPLFKQCYPQVKLLYIMTFF